MRVTTLHRQIIFLCILINIGYPTSRAPGKVVDLTVLRYASILQMMNSFYKTS
jgi:hypothetical protein